MTPIHRIHLNIHNSTHVESYPVHSNNDIAPVGSFPLTGKQSHGKECSIRPFSLLSHLCCLDYDVIWQQLSADSWAQPLTWLANFISEQHIYVKWNLF